MGESPLPGRRPLALVTGVGRRAGIGAAIAFRLAEDGFDTAITSWAPYDDRMYTTTDSFDRHFAVNARASWLLSRELVDRFPGGGGVGQIVALTSDSTGATCPTAQARARWTGS